MNPSWRQLFTNADVLHLPKPHSDQCPVLLIVNPNRGPWHHRIFRSEAAWHHHPTFKDLLRESLAEGGYVLIESIACFQSHANCLE